MDEATEDGSPPISPKPAPKSVDGFEATLRRNERSSWGLWLLFFVATLFGGCALLLSNLGWTKGRPLRGRRRSKRGLTTPTNASDARTAADVWRSIAADEHESVATFGELALDLMAAGAPTALVVRCHEAALEEVRHTEACLAVAQRLDGQAVPPLALPALRSARRRPRWRTALLVRLAAESYVDGCIGEGSSAWVLAKVKKQTTDDSIREVLNVLAVEEAGHARLGHDIVRWCRDAGGPVVEHALLVAQRRLEAMDAPSFIRGVPSLRDFGVPDDALRAEGFARARTTAAKLLARDRRGRAALAA